MSHNFGVISNYIEIIKKMIIKNKLSHNELNKFKNKIELELKIDRNIIDEILNKLFK